MNTNEFGALLETYLAEKRDTMRNRFNRVLPTGELLFNRFDKAPYLHCGEGSSIYDTSVVMGDVEIGNHVWVGPYTLLDGSNAPLKISDYVSIDSGVMIYTHDSTRYYVSGGINPFDKGAVFIGEHTVIGTMSSIGCGVRIGSHCVIAAHSYVNKDIPDYSIAAGTPARIIGEVKTNKDGSVSFAYFSHQIEKSGKEEQDA